MDEILKLLKTALEDVHRGEVSYSSWDLKYAQEKIRKAIQLLEAEKEEV